MYVDANTIILAASVFSALVVIFSAVFAVYRWYLKQNQQDEDIKNMKAEQAKEMETKEFTATAGGGAVEVTVSGSKKLVKVKLDEEVVDPDDVEMLEDLLVAAVNEALDKVDEASAASMSKFTGGMNGLL